MTVGIHAVPALKPRPTGVEVYAREVITRMIASAGEKAALRLYVSHDPCAEEQDALCESDAEIRVLRAPFLWTQGRLSLEMVLHRPDILFVPGNALPRVLPKRTAAVLHGVEFMQTPEYYAPSARKYLKAMTQDTLRRADAVIVPSFATASALSEYFGADESKLYVIHHGAPAQPSRQTNNKQQTTNKRPYFLYVGRLETHKNVQGLIDAFSAFMRSRPDSPHNLLLAGKPGFGYEVIEEAIARSGCADRIMLPGYITEEEKWSLLRGAAAFCYPSFAEGFGLPVLEAQAAGVPVMTANVTAMPEVAGATGALLVDPHDTEQIGYALERMADSDDLRKTLIRHGRENLTRFSWNKAARATFDVLMGQ